MPKRPVRRLPHTDMRRSNYRRAADPGSEIRRYANRASFWLLLDPGRKIVKTVVEVPVVGGIPIAEVVTFSAIRLAHLKAVLRPLVNLVVLDPLIAHLFPQSGSLTAVRTRDADIFQRVGAGPFGEPVFALNRIDMDAEQVIPALGALEDFVPDPGTRISIRANQDACVGGVIQAIIDEPFQRGITLLLDSLPDRRIVKTRRLPVGLRQPVVSDGRTYGATSTICSRRTRLRSHRKRCSGSVPYIRSKSSGSFGFSLRSASCSGDRI
jgi:hypothetical protein